MTVQTKDVQITREGFDDFIASLKYPPNQFQRDILESIAFGDGNLMVNALAGSGKTSLLVMTADLFHKMGIKDVMYLAFNVSIRNELNERLPHGYSAVNSHSLGNNLIKQHLKSNARLGKWKLSDIAKETIEKHGGAFLSKWELYTLGRRLEGITSKVMLNNVNPADHASVMSTAEFFGYGDDEESDKESPISISDLCAMVPRVIDASWQRFQATGEITFDEMLYYPVKHIDPDAFPKHDWVLVDECQDLNALQQIIAMRSVRETGRILLVGDIRQAIYLFSGADARSFDNMIEMTNAKVLPLNICYRCPTSHLNLARSIVPQILPRDGAPEGQVKYIKPDQMPDVSEPGTMILSRTKAPLLSAYFDLLTARKPAVVLGRDIGKELSKTLTDVSKMPMFSYDKIGQFLNDYKAEKVARLAQRDSNDEKIQNLTDKIEAIAVCAESFTDCHNIDDLKKAMESLFIDPEEAMKGRAKGIILCTVHKAKGLEADNVIILNIDKMPLTWPKQKPEEREQEMNIKYVALTRGKKNLYIITPDGEAVMNETPLPDSDDAETNPLIDALFEEALKTDTTDQEDVPAPQRETVAPEEEAVIEADPEPEVEAKQEPQGISVLELAKRNREALEKAKEARSIATKTEAPSDDEETPETADENEPEFTVITNDKDNSIRVIDDEPEEKKPELTIVQPSKIIDTRSKKRQQIISIVDDLNDTQMDALMTLLKAFAS